MITDNIATVLTNLFIGYYGKTAHKPRWMSIGCLVTGLSVMLTALPYFIYGPAKEDDLEYSLSALKLSTFGNSSSVSTISGETASDNDQICQATKPETNCNVAEMSANSAMTAVAVFCFGASNFFRGFGTSIYFTYGTPYLDDNVSKSKMPLFFAFTFAARILGTPIGYYLSSMALKVYESPFNRPVGIVDTDPRWIGAWWIGFLVSGTLLLMLSFPLSLFPREFKKKKPTTTTGADVGSSGELDVEEAQQQIATTTTNAELDAKQQVQVQKPADTSNELSLKQLPGEIWQIVTHPILACQLMGNLFRGIGLIGYFVFQTKYLEAQFRQSASKASLVSGTTGFLAKIAGVMLGGALISLFRPGPKTLTTYIFLVESFSVVALMYAASIMGPHYAYPQTSMDETHGTLNLINECNKNCYCDDIRYQPICETADMKAYFSPCHAGCKTPMKQADGEMLFMNCDCVESPTRGVSKCPPDTDGLYKYALVVAIGSMVSGSSRPGNMVTFFRSIKQDQKSLAVAVYSFWHSLFVAIPYPILYGKIFDSSCLVWSQECDKRGNCWLYDTEKLRNLYHNVSIGLVMLGSVFDLIMIFLSGRLNNLYDDDDDSFATTLRKKFSTWRQGKKTPPTSASPTDATGANSEQDPKRRLEAHALDPIKPNLNLKAVD